MPETRNHDATSGAGAPTVSAPGAARRAAASEEEERAARPASLMVVYLWDAVLTMLAFFGALAPLGAGIDVGGRTVEIPGILQVALALQGCAMAAAVIVVMISLTRRYAWVRVAQILVLVLGMLLAIVSLAATQLVHHDVSAQMLPGIALLLLVDLSVLYLMTAAKLRAWYVLPGKMPTWVRAIIAFWVAGGAALIVAQSLL